MDDLVYRNGLYFEKFLDVPFTGEIEGLDQGKFKIGKFKEGKKEGYWEYYFENGQLWKKGKYQNGNREGLWVSHYPDGKLNGRGHYRNDKMEGEWIIYNYEESLQSADSGTYKNGVEVSD